MAVAGLTSSSGKYGYEPAVMSTYPSRPYSSAVGEDGGAAVDVRGEELRQLELAAPHHLADDLEGPRAVAHVQIDDAGLAAEHAAHACVGGQADQLVHGGPRRAVIGHGDLAHADHLVDERQVAAHVAEQRGRGHLVGAGVDPAAGAFGAQRLGLHQQALERTREAVGAQGADHRGDAALEELADAQLGGARGRAAFAAGPGDVHVAVDEAGQRQQAPAVDHVGLDAAGRRDAGTYGHDAPAGEQHVGAAERLGRVHLDVAKQDHGRSMARSRDREGGGMVKLIDRRVLRGAHFYGRRPAIVLQGRSPSPDRRRRRVTGRWCSRCPPASGR